MLLTLHRFVSLKAALWSGLLASCMSLGKCSFPLTLAPLAHALCLNALIFFILFVVNINI